MGRRKGQYGGRCGWKVEEKGMWGVGCSPGEAEPEETPQRRRGGRDEPNQRKPGKGKERKTNRELQVGGSQPPFSSPIPLFNGSCRPPKIRVETRTRVGGQGVGGRERPVLPGAGQQRRDCGLPAVEWVRRTARKLAGTGSPAGWVYPRPPAPGGARPGAILSLYQTLCPTTWQLPLSSGGSLLPLHSRVSPPLGTAGTRGTRGSLALRPPVRGCPDRAGKCRGGGDGSGGRGKGRARENGGVAGAREGTQHSRPAPRVAPPQRDTSGTDAADNARPGALTWGGGGRL
ncbi:uncharacterized protein LOC141727282 [Zonotrichia albicollis]|uniref:uncharacterized protein LOC141727282 n=1 Tax=Zonotrichia albicollis TaxID=44394 RepID=UPI003D80E0CC